MRWRGASSRFEGTPAHVDHARESFAEICSSFQWHLPERYNIAWDVCDRHAGDPDGWR